ncbi:MAG: OmpA family protein [Acidimicrobiia bacterium]
MSKYTSARQSAPPRFGDEQSDDGPVSGIAFALSFFVAFVILVVVAVQFGTSSIEADIQTRSNRALVGAGYPDVSAVATGTAVALSGNIASDQSEEEAFAAVASLEGVSIVEGKLWPLSDGVLDQVVVTGDALDITWDTGTATITGSVSTAEKATFVIDTLGVDFPLGVIAEGLTPIEGLADESAWLGATLGLTQRIASVLPQGRLILDPNSRILTVSGETEDKSLRNELNDLATETAEILGFDVNPAIRLLETGPTEEDVEELQVNLDDLIEGKIVEFESTSFDLTDAGKELLDEISAALELVEGVRVEIAGHTDSRGNDDDNMILSQQRAQAVFDYLVSKGADPERFDVIGYGETQPIADNDTNSGRARNRRIEFTALLEEEA